MADKHECTCGCDHDECTCDSNEEIVYLTDENGQDVGYYYVTSIMHEEKEYVFLQPAEDEDAGMEIYEIQAVVEDGEEFDSLYPVDDDLYEVLYAKLLEMIAQGDDGCDCGDDCDCGDHCHCGDEE